MICEEEDMMAVEDECVRCKVFWWVNTTLKPGTVSGRSRE
jgi:hypothetical protein